MIWQRIQICSIFRNTPSSPYFHLIYQLPKILRFNFDEKLTEVYLRCNKWPNEISGKLNHRYPRYWGSCVTMCWSILHKLKGKINPFVMIWYVLCNSKRKKVTNEAKYNKQKGRTSTNAKKDGYFCHIQHKTQQDGKCLLVVLLKWREQTSWLECWIMCNTKKSINVEMQYGCCIQNKLSQWSDHIYHK